MRSTPSRTWSLTASQERAGRILLTVGVLSALTAFILLSPRGYTFNWYSVWRDGEYGTFLLGGLWVTVYVSFGALVLALLLGIVVGLARMSRNWVWNQLGTIYVEVIRGTPLLVQILVAYYCLSIGVRDTLEALGASATLVEFTQQPVLIGIVTLGVFAGAYVAEIVRAAVESIDPGQTEAALSQGMTARQVYRYVVFPQALRRMVPPMTGQLANLIKDSSLLSLIAVLELTKRGIEVRAATYQTFEVFLPLAGLYLAVCFPLSLVARHLERRLAD